METIPYRKSKIMVKTIPKGTLLFRLTKTSENDTRGVLLEDGTRCITPNFNVFFHPNPFIGHHIYGQYGSELGDTVNVYILEKDIKVILLIEPSKYSRLDRKRKGIFLKRCSTVKKGCMPKEGNSYDPCLSDSVIKKHPEVVGFLAIASGDVKMLKSALKKGIPNRTQKIFKKAKDSTGISSVPELILHPLTERPSENVIVKEGDKLDNNYKLLKKIKYNEDKLHRFMEQHATYDPDTYFYTYKE